MVVQPYRETSRRNRRAALVCREHVKGQELEGEFEVLEIRPDYLRAGWRTTVDRGLEAITVASEGRPLPGGYPSTSAVTIPAHVFRKAVPRWHDYLSGEITRTQFEKVAAHQYSTYVISILYGLENN